MNVRIASGVERLDLRIPEHPRGNSRATVFQRLCCATASDMAIEAAYLNLPASANPFRTSTPEHAAWHQSWLAKQCELGRMQAVEQQLDASEPQPVNFVVRLAIRFRNWLYGETN